MQGTASRKWKASYKGSRLARDGISQEMVLAGEADHGEGEQMEDEQVDGDSGETGYRKGEQTEVDQGGDDPGKGARAGICRNARSLGEANSR